MLLLQDVFQEVQMESEIPCVSNKLPEVLVLLVCTPHLGKQGFRPLPASTAALATRVNLNLTKMKLSFPVTLATVQQPHSHLCG